MGPMCGIDQAIEWLKTRTLNSDDMPQRIIRRLEYIKDKDAGVKPKFHKGTSIHDWYTCGNCGAIVDIGANYCKNCGYYIVWDSCRCLTGRTGRKSKHG